MRDRCQWSKCGGLPSYSHTVCLAFEEGRGYPLPPRTQKRIFDDVEGHINLMSIATNGNKKRCGPKVKGEVLNSFFTFV